MNTTIYPCILLAAVLIFPLQSQAQEDEEKVQCPPEDPPRILVAASIDEDDQLVLVSYHSIFIGFQGDSYNERLLTKVSLDEVQILTLDGSEVTVDEARTKLSEGDTPIVVSSYKKPVPAFYAKLFADQTLQFVFPKRAPKWREIESPGAQVR